MIRQKSIAVAVLFCYNLLRMNHLEVPLLRQAEESSDCGPACLAMILEYYAIDYNFEEMKKELGVYSWGTFTPQLGRYLLQHGFAVEIVTTHPSLFSLHMQCNSVHEMQHHLSSIRDTMKGEFDPIALEHFISFIEAGGTLTPRIPRLHDLEQEIEEKRPVLVPITHWFLHKSDLPPRFSIHFNIVTGIDHDTVTINDPDWGEEFGGKHAINRDAFLYAMYASAKGGIDDACIMKIRRASSPPSPQMLLPR